jgi:hypothetical protein
MFNRMKLFVFSLVLMAPLFLPVIAEAGRRNPG